MSYGYEHFDEYVTSGRDEREFGAFPSEAPRAGEQAPDRTLIRLSDGAPFRLSESWARADVVLEFGSFT